MTHWDTTLPQPLGLLNGLEYDYADGEGIDFEPYSAFQSAEETGSWFRAWTGNKDADGSKFRIFGQDGTGGYAAIWITKPGKSLLEQPVVFIGSEGETGVVASDFEHYVWMLAGGFGPAEAITLPGSPREPNQQFLSFAQKHTTIGPILANDVISKAKLAYPTFSEGIQGECR